MKQKRSLIPAVALAVALSAVGAAPALAATKSPSKFCKQAGEASSKCVNLAEDAREEARDGKKSDGDKKRKPKGAPGKFCRANGANVGSKAYKKCLEKAKKAEKAARRGGGNNGGGNNGGGNNGGGNGGGGGTTPTQCADGRDNDNDGQIDFPSDPDCTSAGDSSEGDFYVPPGEPTRPV